jgi:hypothetical protein
MAGGVKAGPLGSGTNNPVADPGTSVQSATPCPGVVCASLDPLNQLDIKGLKDLVSQLRDLAGAATAKMRSNLYSLPDTDRKQFQRDIEDLEATEVWVVQELQVLTSGQQRDTRNFDMATKRFEDLIAALESGNERCDARMEAGRDELALEIVKGLTLFATNLGKESESLRRDLELLEKRLERGKEQITETKVQMWINVGLYAVSLALPELTIMGKFYKAVAFTAAVMANDRLLGPGSDPWADLDVAAGSLIEACPEGVWVKLIKVEKEFAKASQEYAGLLSAIGTTFFDVKERHEAEEIVEEIESTIKSVRRSLKAVNNVLKDLVPKLKRMNIHGLIQARNKALADAAKYDQIYKDQKHVIDAE